MDFEEALKSSVTKAEARREIEKHDSDGWEQFIKDHGDKESYKGATVLFWLGY